MSHSTAIDRNNMLVPTFMDLQRFIVNTKFIVKEVAVLKQGTVLTHYIFTSPILGYSYKECCNDISDNFSRDGTYDLNCFKYNCRLKINSRQFIAAKVNSQRQSLSSFVHARDVLQTWVIFFLNVQKYSTVNAKW